MKIWKTIFVAGGLCSALAAQAQFQKGSILLEGNAGFSKQFKNEGDGDGYKAPYNLFLGIRGGYFLNARNEIGLGLGWDKSRLNYNPISGFSQEASGFSSSLYWRHYTPIGKRLFFSWSVAGLVGFDNFKTRDLNTGLNYESKSTLLSINAAPSLVWMANSKIGIRGSFGSAGFDFLKDKDAQYWENRFSLNFAPSSLNVGVFLLLKGAESSD
jgi:hypothetical protein